MLSDGTEKDTIIRQSILHWSALNQRPLPWKGVDDPYLIWVSEIILQQTRVQQGTPYYYRFIEAFPDVYALAEATPDQLLKVWEGLGYYRRAKHMHEAANDIVIKFNGIFPDQYQEIRSLKGIGPYTAAAIGSFAFGLPYAVLDGNVARVLARIYGVDDEIDTNRGKSRLQTIADLLLDKSDPGRFNQAIMDFGALHCTPQKPQCDICKLSQHCIAFRTKRMELLPRKKKKQLRRDRYLYYLIIRNSHDQIWLRRRDGNDIWQGLYEFYLVETENYEPWSKIMKSLPFSAKVQFTSDKYKQMLTHQRIFAFFAEVLVEDLDVVDKVDGVRILKRDNLQNLAFPKVIDCYLTDNNVNLNLTF